ncbi:hypothetical protein CHCC14820_3593 [Bacillus paralicheniformis]|nr:hypothetical protein B4123_0451 [Bacillus paralicheniformis]TWJ52224.1 hypothetical protein CHCC5023_4345 [Bacillus paralicheniformis]TWJ70792.1 hypothetical protein CHCC5019_3853 [Bacillus paralicheniformis]TWM37695.1 hypothetical protein CHCC14820_3593 [Bacillus paralicheniformis]TWN86672.1 hypothetical protein CHCC20490_4207 [Bacillus paralicheniformis]
MKDPTGSIVDCFHVRKLDRIQSSFQALDDILFNNGDLDRFK